MTLWVLGANMREENLIVYIRGKYLAVLIELTNERAVRIFCHEETGSCQLLTRRKLEKWVGHVIEGLAALRIWQEFLA